jgi:peptidoglycan/LPS O-acetylase OafA/YrhL
MSAGTLEGETRSLEASGLERSFVRQHYIDWLRVLAVLLLFPFHTLRVYNTELWYVKAAHLSTTVTYLLDFISAWHMQLLFLLAGASTCLALRKRGNRQYVGERLLRLGVPFVFGVLVLVPPQCYFGARSNAGYTGSYWDYVSSGDFFRFSSEAHSDYYGYFGFGQLWFIILLLVLSLIALPLFAWGRGGRGGVFLQGFSRRLARPLWWLLPALLAFVGDALPDPTGEGIWYYLVFFVLGYLVVRDAAFMESAERFRLPALALGLALCAWWSLGQDFRDSLPDPSPQLAAIVYLGMMGTWLMMIGLLGYGKRHLDRPSPALAYLAEGSYPVYVLHQTVIVVLAFYLVGWAVWQPLQWLALLVLSVLGTFALYEGVRRWSVTRFLFGMRRKQRRPAEAGKAGRAAVGSEETTAAAR